MYRSTTRKQTIFSFESNWKYCLRRIDLQSNPFGLAFQSGVRFAHRRSFTSDDVDVIREAKELESSGEYRAPDVEVRASHDTFQRDVEQQTGESVP